MSYGATDSTASAGQSQNASLPSAIGTGRNGENRSTRQSLKAFYDRNFGLFLVFLAQTCGSIMNTAAKLLANDPTIKFHALQIIFIRMLSTTILGSSYMWYHKVPDFPLGPRGVRKYLVLRGAAGFMGIFGLYYSLSWLNFADATVITFIIPTMTAFVCFVWLREPFTINEALAGLIAFTGVLFVARPPWLFPGPPRDPISGQPEPHGLAFLTSTMQGGKAPTLPMSPHKRTLVILIAIMGTFGASTAYATIRIIGKRTHSLISVNYFAAIATIGSTIIITVHPDLHFVMPKSAGQWGLVAIIGVAGFLLQFLLTEGLQREKGGRATNLTYVQLVFALVVERVIWGTTPPVESLIGALLIIGAAVWVSLQKNSAAAAPKKADVVDEESSLLGTNEEGER
ncbi:uncharacterized protein K460DRAFT_357210 [Cucurbitaria berberidis CBS 394.84]|uniref:EamA domain-containing protein n=1 Tax=Cucurbitaria berberidis CBS 394.84 TaxID=1168544 RepID=A0A9P4L6L4_9PLEO|nr:uncharacterized protein K460DRAFT_357210 [Cucurbitaria berberidis CBS 394.84]KAF1843487.1 hypothetical protein K460DRAFT_357210 [Cucurbitaria berberidis CBS 394.84]